MATRKKTRKTALPRKRSASLRARTSDTRKSAPKLNAQRMMPANVVARVMRVYAELPLRLARCRTPFELHLEQCLVGPRLIAALQPDPA